MAAGGDLKFDCVELGYALMSEEKLPKDVEYAFPVFLIEAENDVDDGMVHVGVFYKHGVDVVEKNEVKAVKYFKKAAALENGNGYAHLGE